MSMGVESQKKLKTRRYLAGDVHAKPIRVLGSE